MTTPVVEAALAAIAARLASAVPGAAVERARRAPVELDTETLPRLVLQVDSLDADSTAEPGSTHYRLSFIVVGTANGASDLAAQQSVISLHASVVAALAGWTPSTAGLGDMADRPATSLALGQQRIVEIARALCLDPVMLLLDEPAAGLRHNEKTELASLLRRLRAEGVTILLVEHDMEFVMGLVDRLVVMDFGTKLAEGPAERVRRDPRVIEAYLGSVE